MFPVFRYNENMSNCITILRKQVNNNIPMFSDEETTPQAKWFRVIDLKCIDADPGVTARVYELEHAENYQNQDTSTYYNFSFDSAHQTMRPPYDIMEGDYVAYRQGDMLFYWKVVKREVVQLFHNCCTYILTCNVTNPRDAEKALGCGVMKILTDEEIEEIGVYE